MEGPVEIKSGAVRAPAGEGSRGLANILFGVVADAQAEQLHQLAGIVFIGPALQVAVGVKPDQHGAVTAHRLQHRAKPPQSMLAQQAVLAIHQCRILHLDETGGEMVVPEEGQFLAQRVAALEYAIEPPAPKLVTAVVTLGGKPADIGQRFERLGRLRPSFEKQIERPLGSKT